MSVYALTKDSAMLTQPYAYEQGIQSIKTFSLVSRNAVLSYITRLHCRRCYFITCSSQEPCKSDCHL